MRRDFRRKEQDNNKKIMMYSIVGVVVLLAVVFTLLMYGSSLNKEVKNSQLSPEQIASIVNNETNSASVSSNMGKTVDEAKEETDENVQNATTNTQNEVSNTNIASNANLVTNTANTSINSNTNTAVKQTTATNVSNNKPVKTKKELNFKKPVEGEIMREYAKENLIFSETLQEWVTHDGIDIKAPKTTVVQAAEEGIVKSIKNDPRYGLTIVIEHEDGFETVYANLLSSEFVTEGEKVTQGQSIGTVGNTGVFESADEPHLHFEILKDNIKVDPNIYLK